MHNTIKRELSKNDSAAIIAGMRAEELDVLIGRNLRRLREARQISQKQLADTIQTPAPRISAYESGYEGMGKDIMARVCNALGVQPWEFYITDQTPCIVDENEKRILYTIREAEALGVADDIERYGIFRIAEAKKTTTATSRKSGRARHQTR